MPAIMGGFHTCSSAIVKERDRRRGRRQQAMEERREAMSLLRSSE